MSERYKDADVSFDRVKKAMEAINKATLGKHPASGEIDCPNCGGRLKYSLDRPRAAFARCSTPGCVQFMS